MRASACGGLVALLGGHLPTHHPVAEGTQPGRDLVDGRGGDHQDTEECQQRQQRHHDVRGLEQVHQQLGDDEADCPARLLEGCGVAELGGGRAVGDVHDPEHAEQQRGPADHLAAGGAVGLGVTEVAPSDEASSSGTSHASNPTEPATTVRVKSPMPPGSCHHTAAATTRATPTRNRPHRRDGVRDRARWRCARRGVRRRRWRAPAPARPSPAAGRLRRRTARRDPARCAPPGAPVGELHCRACGRRSTSGRTSGRACARSCCPTAGNVCSNSPVLTFGQRCSCHATPAGKTYGSPWFGIYPEDLICPSRHTPHSRCVATPGSAASSAGRGQC